MASLPARVFARIPLQRPRSRREDPCRAEDPGKVAQRDHLDTLIGVHLEKMPVVGHEVVDACVQSGAQDRTILRVGGNLVA